MSAPSLSDLLALVRAGQASQALPGLRTARDAAPDDTRVALVLARALRSAGLRAEA